MSNICDLEKKKQQKQQKQSNGFDRPWWCYSAAADATLERSSLSLSLLRWSSGLAGDVFGKLWKPI